MLRYIPSIPSFFRDFVMKGSWMLLKAFSASVEMIKWFSSFLLLLWCITVNYSYVLNHLCIPGMKQTWSWCMIFLNMLLSSVCSYFIEILFIVLGFELRDFTLSDFASPFGILPSRCVCWTWWLPSNE
jgi:hypothetical protein